MVSAIFFLAFSKLFYGLILLEMRITKDTVLPENTMFDPEAQLPDQPRKKKCSDNAEIPSTESSRHS